MFDSINEIAVCATAAVYIAVSIIWYSQTFFGKIWSAASSITATDSKSQQKNIIVQLLGTYISNVLVCGILAYAISITSVLKVSVTILAIAVTVFVWSFLAILSLSEYKSRLYFLVHAGYVALFIIGATMILNYWPW